MNINESMFNTQKKLTSTSQDANNFAVELKSRNLYNLIPFATVKCTMGCVKDFDTMFITKEEEACINICYDKVLDIYILAPIK